MRIKVETTSFDKYDKKWEEFENKKVKIKFKVS